MFTNTDGLKNSNHLLDIPDTWLVVPFEQVVFFQEGPGLRKYQFCETGIPFLNIRTLRNERVELSLCQYLDTNEVLDKYQHFLLEAGDIVASSSGTLGKTALIHSEDLPLMLNTSIIRFRPYGASEPIPGFIHWFLKSERFLSQAVEASTGSAQVNFGPSHLRKMKFFLPPLNEQHRIVAKIEALMARSRRVKEALEAIPPLIDQFRQSVLAAAFRGDLTADWREKNLDIEPASVLLERICAERRHRWEEVELERMKADAKTSTDDKWKSKYKKPEPPDTSELPTLPENWGWACVEQIADVGTGATPLRSERKYYEGGEIPWVTSGALNALFITNAEEYITPLAIKETNAKVFHKHTLLIAMYGEGKTRGKVSELLVDAATNQACAGLVIEGLASNIRPIVKLFFQKNYSALRRLASGGVQPNLNLSMIKATAVPLPPLEEQTEIIQMVDRCMSVADVVEKQYLDNINLINYLDQSILAKAFRGELVPQNPNDEPASVLLERIRAERAKREAEAKVVKKSTGKTSRQGNRKEKQQDLESIQLGLPGLE